MSSEKFLKEYLCSHCHVALMYEHPETHKYLKCIFCGFCKPKEQKEIIEIHKITGNRTSNG